MEIATKNQENLPEKYDGTIKIKKPRGVMIFNEGKNDVYSSMSGNVSDANLRFDRDRQGYVFGKINLKVKKVKF